MISFGDIPKILLDLSFEKLKKVIKTAKRVSTVNVGSIIFISLVDRNAVVSKALHRKKVKISEIKTICLKILNKIDFLIIIPSFY